MSQWQLDPSSQYLRKYRKFSKKHSNELIALLNNLDTILKFLNKGVPLSQIRFGWLHREPMGVLAITEAGGHGKGLMASRLYIYPDNTNRKLLLITLGDKRTQNTDINYCKKYVKDIKE